MFTVSITVLANKNLAYDFRKSLTDNDLYINIVRGYFKLMYKNLSVFCMSTL